MSKIKVLNLYSGIGGNRKLWPDDMIEVTSVEYNKEIANVYKDYFPNDKLIIGDAHQYLLDHYKEYDFIWASPPCPTHSDIRRLGVQIGQVKPEYPDMKLYQEIIFLQNFFKGVYCIENVKPYYEPLIKGQYSGRHLFWSNFIIGDYKNIACHHSNRQEMQDIKGFDISKYKLETRKDKILRNCVDPKLGLHVFNCAFRKQQLTLFQEG